MSQGLRRSIHHQRHRHCGSDLTLCSWWSKVARYHHRTWWLTLPPPVDATKTQAWSHSGRSTNRAGVGRRVASSAGWRPSTRGRYDRSEMETLFEKTATGLGSMVAIDSPRKGDRCRIQVPRLRSARWQLEADFEEPGTYARPHRKRLASSRPNAPPLQCHRLGTKVIPGKVVRYSSCRTEPMHCRQPLSLG